MTDEELKALVASIAIAQHETDHQIQELRASQQETDRQLQETDRQLRKQMKELGKQIGGLGEKFGSFTEGMAFPAMSRILTRKFGMEAITTRLKVRKGGKTLELDVFGYANSTLNRAIVVEVKSHLRAEAIPQMEQIMGQVRDFLPEHRDKQFYGMVAIVDGSDKLRREVMEAGFYLAEIHDEQFLLKTPADFVPKGW